MQPHSKVVGVKKSRYGLLKILLPVIFIGYIAVLSLCTHVHIVDGIAIVHAHPYQNAQNHPIHTHTSGAYQILSVLSSVLTTTDAVFHFTFNPLRVLLATLLPESRYEEYVPAVAGTLSLRAPPAFTAY